MFIERAGLIERVGTIELLLTMVHLELDSSTVAMKIADQSKSHDY